jgi:hypothetical protein
MTGGARVLKKVRLIAFFVRQKARMGRAMEVKTQTVTRMRKNHCMVFGMLDVLCIVLPILFLA